MAFLILLSILEWRNSPTGILVTLWSTDVVLVRNVSRLPKAVRWANDVTVGKMA